MGQSYSFNPGATFIYNIDTNSTDFGGIDIINTGNQNLNLSWKHVLADTLIDSRFELCNSGICFLNLPHSGAMPTITPSNSGWIKFHMYSGVATGTNTIKYLVKNGSIQNDTLTFKIIVSSSTSINEVDNIKKVSLFPNPTSSETSINLVLFNPSKVNITLLDNVGQIVYQSASTLSAGSNKVNIDTRNLASGIYNVLVATENGSVTKKLSVTK